MDLYNLDISNRIFGLDVLRAFAIIFVVYAHGMQFLQPYIEQDSLNIFLYDGVTLFFVLSGFLIGRILIKVYFKSGDLKWKDLWLFWVRRWFRTVPPYFIMLIFLLVLGYFTGLNPNINYTDYFLFIQNLWYPHPAFFPEAWSLSVEEWFYLSFPLLLFTAALIFKLRSHEAFLFLVGSIFLVGVSYRTYVCLDAMSDGISVHKIYGLHLRKVVLSRVDSMMLGVFAAYIFSFFRTFWDKNRVVFFVMGIILFAISRYIPYHHYPFFRGVFSFTIVSLATFLLLPFLNSVREAKGWLAKIIVIISISSYSMYLVNLTIAHFVIKNLPQDSFSMAMISYVVYLLLCFVISFFAYQHIERPILRLRDRIYKKQSI